MRVNETLTPKQFEELKRTLNSEGQLAFEFRGQSMLPVIKPGSLVTIENPKQFEKFDIVVFFFRDKLICHYVWHKNSLNTESFVTRGLNSGEDVPVTMDRALGRVTNYKIGFLRRLKLNLEAIRNAR